MSASTMFLVSIQKLSKVLIQQSLFKYPFCLCVPLVELMNMLRKRDPSLSPAIFVALDVVVQVRSECFKEGYAPICSLIFSPLIY